MADFNQVYHQHLDQLLREPGMEMFNHSFMLESVSPIPVVRSKARNFNLEYAEAFARLCIKGGPISEEVLKHRPDAKDFIEEVEGRNPAYGPRIQKQFWGTYMELVENPMSRRAVIMILSEEDQKISQWKRKKPDSKVEYPCTMGLTFFRRNGALDLHVSMRSSNACTTICYDVFNFATLQKMMAALLNCPTGRFFWNAVNSHIVAREVGLAQRIVNEWKEGQA